MMGGARSLICAVAFSLAMLSAQARELHALVVGFDHYQHVQKLLGAEADATDIAGVMRKRGVRDLVVLTDPATTVANFQIAWSEMVAKASPGDTILFTFAGHGMRVPETHIPHRTPDGYDKGFLFPSYDQDKQADELLRDEDLYDLFKSAALRDLHVVFVADACHAGSGIRGASPSAPVRFQRFNLRGSEAPSPAAEGAPPRPPLHSVAVFSAQIQEKAISEISVDGVSRGALSFAVARGLEGAADADESGTITVNKLYDYVRPVVRDRSGFSQAPTLYAVAGDADMPVLAGAPRQVRVEAAGFPALPKVALFQSEGASASEPPAGAVLVADKTSAELVYDAGAGQLIASTGDIVAFDLKPADLAEAVAARRLMNALQTLADRGGPLPISLAAGDGLYIEGARAAVRVATSPFDNVAILDLTASGRLILLYPRAGESSVSHNTNILPVVKVSEPFGADDVIVLRSEKRLDLLLGAFSRERGYFISATEGAAAFRAAFGGSPFRVGVQGLFTCRKLTELGQCNAKSSSSP